MHSHFVKSAKVLPQKGAGDAEKKYKNLCALSVSAVKWSTV